MMLPIPDIGITSVAPKRLMPIGREFTRWIRLRHPGVCQASLYTHWHLIAESPGTRSGSC